MNNISLKVIINKSERDLDDLLLWAIIIQFGV
jgi:hypothetical protein